MTDAAVQRLLDESDLRDLIHRYAFGLDNKDWDLWRSIFAEEVIIDMTDWMGGGPVPAPLPADKHVRGAARLFEHFDRTQHFMGSHRYEIDTSVSPNTAVITAHMRAEHWRASAGENDGLSDRYTMYGTYTDRCVRTDDGWKIVHVKLAKIWEQGNRSIMTGPSKGTTK